MPELTALANMYPAGIVYRASVALKSATRGRIANMASSVKLKPTGGGYLMKAQLTMVVAMILESIPNPVARRLSFVLF